MILYILQYPKQKKIMRKKTTSQIICQNFKIPPETIFQDYKCTYRSSVLFFGRLYIGEQHFLFIANMFGLVKKCSIKIDSILKIQQSDNYSVITVTEKVDNQEVQYIFGSFKNNNAYQLMRAIWKGEQIGSDILNNRIEEDNEQLNKGTFVQKKLSIDQGQVQANFFNHQLVDAEKQKIVQIVFPCTVEQFFDFFLSDTATVYPRKKHLENRGGKDIAVTQWRKSQELNSEVRQITGMLKVNGVPFVKQAGMSQVWMIKRSQNIIKLNIVTQMADVPYAAYFNCEQHMAVIKQGDKKCKMTIQTAIIFNKSTYMKGTIISRTFGDLKEQYQFWIKNVNIILDQIRKKNEKPTHQKNPYADVEYQASQVSSQKMIPMAPQKPTKKPNILSKLNKPINLPLQQKVDLILKLLILLVVLNLVNLVF